MKFMFIALVFLTLTLNTSCLKKQNLDEEDLGPAIAPAELTKAMTDGFGSLNYGNIKANEFNSYVLTQKIQDSRIDTLEQQDLTIETSVDSAAKLIMDFVVTKTKYSAGQSSQSTRKWHKEYKKESESSSLSAEFSTLADNDEPTMMFLVFQNLAFGSCIADGVYPETCHHLEVSDFKFKVPQTASSQHQCTDPDNCFIDARKIEFDMITKNQIDKDGKPKRTHFTVILSKQVPYMSRVLQFCSRRLYDISSSQQKILADLCYNVNSYAFGNQ